MKKLHYTITENTFEINPFSGNEQYLLTASSAATLANAHETITGETSGNCFGPNDDNEDILEFATANWVHFIEMTKEEEDARIEHLAEEWGLPVEELDYLR